MKYKIKKALYWHDWVDEEDEASDLKHQVVSPCKEKGITFDTMEATDIPPLFYEQARDFDVLFFDWGGMSMGNTMMEHFCGNIIEHAENHPSKYYIMVSTFTEDAMREAIAHYGDDRPFNVFLNIDEFAEHLNQMNKGGKK